MLTFAPISIRGDRKAVHNHAALKLLDEIHDVGPYTGRRVLLGAQMSEKLRIERNMSRASKAIAQMHGSEDAEMMQSAWEDFLGPWRAALNQIFHYCETSGQAAKAQKFHAERVATPILDYVWEARNAEHHEATGSSDASLVLVEYHLTDQNGDRLIDENDDALTGLFSEKVLEFRPVTTQRRKPPVTLAPPSLPPTDVAVIANDFLQRFYADVQW